MDQTLIERCNEKIKKAATTLIVVDLQYACGMFSHALVCAADEQISTCATDGARLIYNPAFVDCLSPSETRTVLLHEFIHVLGQHAQRGVGKDHELWNLAADAWTNAALTLMRYQLSGHLSGAWIDPDVFPDYETVESIYERYQRQPLKRKQQDPGGFLLPQTASDKQQARDNLLQSLEQAKKVASWGESVVDKLAYAHPSRPDAVSALYNLLRTAITREDYTWQRPNRNLISQGLYLPSLRSERTGDIAIVLDTSSSISHDWLVSSTQMTIGLLDCIRDTKVHLYCVNSSLQTYALIEPGDKIPTGLIPRASGGTSFVPAFEDLVKRGIEVDGLIYFTDLDCDDWPPEPDYPVVWFVYATAPKHPARWGVVIREMYR
jgi:predicted metal-dependent peptidase